VTGVVVTALRRAAGGALGVACLAALML